MISITEATQADAIAADLESRYNVTVKDWGFEKIWTNTTIQTITIDPWTGRLTTTTMTVPQVQQVWKAGFWRRLEELQWTSDAIDRMATRMGASKFRAAMGQTRITRAPLQTVPFAPPPPLSAIGNVELTDYLFDWGVDYATFNIIHEFGHHWDWRNNNRLSIGMAYDIGTLVCAKDGYCKYNYFACLEDAPGVNYDAATGARPYAMTSMLEDWAEAFATFNYPEYYAKDPKGNNPLGPLRFKYVNESINSLP